MEDNNNNNININLDNLNISEKEKDTNISKLERFAKISEKINSISKVSENKDPQKYEKIESKINEVEENFNTNIDSLEQKYNILKEQISKFAKIIEEDKINKEKSKKKIQMI